MRPPDAVRRAPAVARGKDYFTVGVALLLVLILSAFWLVFHG